MKSLSTTELHRFVALATLLFFGCSILLPWAEIGRFFVFAVAMPVSLYIAISRGWPRELATFPFVILGLLVAYLVVNSALVSDVSPYQDFRRARWGIEILLFLLSLVFAFHYWLQNPRTMSMSFSVISGGAALVAVGVHLFGGDVSERITGFGFLGHTIRGSSTLLMLWTIGATGYVLARHSVRRRDQILLVASGVCVALFLILSQSRGPLATAVVLACIYLFCLMRFDGVRLPRFRSVFIVVASVASLFVYSGAFAFTFEVLANRGLSYRPQIWESVIEHLPSFWLTGVGQATEFAQTLPGQGLSHSLGYTFDHAHNIFLQALLIGGVPAFLALTVVCTYLFWGILTLRSELLSNRLALVAMLVAFICLNLTDTARFLSSPRPDWLLLWAPLAMCGVYLSLARQGTLGDTKTDV